MEFRKVSEMEWIVSAPVCNYRVLRLGTAYSVYPAASADGLGYECPTLKDCADAISYAESGVESLDILEARAELARVESARAALEAQSEECAFDFGDEEGAWEYFNSAQKLGLRSAALTARLSRLSAENEEALYWESLERSL